MGQILDASELFKLRRLAALLGEEPGALPDAIVWSPTAGRLWVIGDDWDASEAEQALLTYADEPDSGRIYEIGDSLVGDDPDDSPEDE